MSFNPGQGEQDFPLADIEWGRRVWAEMAGDGGWLVDAEIDEGGETVFVHPPCRSAEPRDAPAWVVGMENGGIVLHSPALARVGVFGSLRDALRRIAALTPRQEEFGDALLAM